jgi:hypothetical protein
MGRPPSRDPWDDEDDDNWYELPPVEHPAREAFAICLVVSLVLGIIGWGLWTLAWRALGVWG